MGYEPRINKNISGESFADELHSSVGSSAFTMNHDYFWGGSDLEIWTAASKTGTQLTQGTDYTLGGSTGTTAVALATESGKTCYTEITVINATYQAVDLYFSGSYIGDDNSWFDVEDRARRNYKLEITSDHTVDPDEYYDLILVSPSAALVVIDLPAITEDLEDFKIRFKGGTFSGGVGRITPNGSDVINGPSGSTPDYLFLFEKGQEFLLEVVDGEWFTKDTIRFDSGFINFNDWTAVKLGFAQITYDNLSGTFEIGEIITESTTGNTWIVIHDTGTLLTCVGAIGSGVATNNETLTGSYSGATADVNGDTKNVGSYARHGLGVRSDNIDVKLVIYEGTPPGAYTQDDVYYPLYAVNTGVSGQQAGLSFFYYDDDTAYLQTGLGGFFAVFLTAGNVRQYTTNDVCYKIKIEVS